MRFHLLCAGLAVCLGMSPLAATQLSPFIDLQEAGLHLSSAGKGGTGSVNINIGGTVRFGLLYWNGSQQPCSITSPGSCDGFGQPFGDQDAIFNGTSVTGTVIGSETQPNAAGGALLNVGYFADVTSLIMPLGTGSHNVSFADDNLGNNLTTMNGFGLLIGYTDPVDTAMYRVVIWDGLDSTDAADPDAGPQTTTTANLNHGAIAGDRLGRLILMAGGGGTGGDTTSISNNAALVDSFDASSGVSWDTDELDVFIPGGVSTTSVQVLSQGGRVAGDRLLWEVAAMRVGFEANAGVPEPSTFLLAGLGAAVVMFRRRYQR